MKIQKSGRLVFFVGLLSMFFMMCILVAEVKHSRSVYFNKRDDNESMYYSGSGMLPEENDTVNSTRLIGEPGMS